MANSYSVKKSGRAGANGTVHYLVWCSDKSYRNDCEQQDKPPRPRKKAQKNIHLSGLRPRRLNMQVADLVALAEEKPEDNQGRKKPRPWWK